MDPTRIYDYLVRSRAPVLDAARELTPAHYHQAFGFGLGSIAATLAHIMISEWYYIERLEGRDVPPYESWPIQYERPPGFEVIDRAWREQAPRVRAAIAGERDPARRITYTTFPDEQGRRFRVTAAAGDILAQVALHEVHHRAQVMAMLRLLGHPARPVQDIDYNDLMYERTPLA